MPAPVRLHPHPLTLVPEASHGLTSALAITGPSRRDVIRQVVLGALVAGGLGTAAGGVLAAWLGLPAGAIPAVGVGGAASYLSGVFGPALFEVLLGRIRAGRLPGEPPAQRSEPRDHGGARNGTADHGGTDHEGADE